jgi:hypothetical protein
VGQAYVSLHVALVRLKEASHGQFLHLWTTSPEHGRATLSADAYGAGKPGLNLDNIRNLPVALPPREERDEIVRRVQALFALADAIEKRVAQATARVEKTTQAILVKAFRGELVPTEAELARQEGRDYELASVLLERVRAERAQAEPARGARRPRQSRSKKTKNSRPAPETPQHFPVACEATASAATPAQPNGNIPQAILRFMHPGVEYARADILEPLAVAPSEWSWAIAQLKEGGQVVQSGQRRGARYRLAGSRE